MPSADQHAETFRRLVTGAERILLTITRSPDGDSVGSLVATRHAVEHFGRRCDCYSPEPIPAMYRYLTDGQPIMRDVPNEVHAYDLVIIFDTGDMRRTPLVADLARRNPAKTHVLNIDHHPTITDLNGASLVDTNVVDTTASSTTQMLYRLFTAAGVPIPPRVATSLLTGILTDTGHFANPNTTEEAMAIAAELMRRGADHRLITISTMRSKSIGTLQLWGRALSRLNLNRASGIVSTVLTEQDFLDCGVDREASTGIPNFLNSLSDGKVAMVLQEEPGGVIKGSLRTTSDINVADLAKQFGGGGHAKAAGFKVRGKLVKTKGGWRVESPPPLR